MTHGPILIISGTNRPDSSALRIAKVLEGMYGELEVRSRLLSLCDLPVELFSPHVYSAKPASFQAIQWQVLESAGLHLVVPEYNGSFPGILKYFIDMLKFPESFERRPVAFVGESNGAWGAVRAVEQLQMVFGYRNAFSFPERVFISRVKEKFGAAGDLTDPDLKERLTRQVKGFTMFAEMIRNVP
jgi:NAD(P)H-dependent FMN reductase